MEQEQLYPTAIHTPTGRVFGGEIDTDIVMKDGRVEVRYTDGITVSFSGERSVLCPGTRRTYRYETTPKPKSFLRSLIDKLAT